MGACVAAFDAASAMERWNSFSCCCGVAGTALAVLGTLGADGEGVELPDIGVDGTPTLGVDGALGELGALGIPGMCRVCRACQRSVCGGGPREHPRAVPEASAIDGRGGTARIV